MNTDKTHIRHVRSAIPAFTALLALLCLSAHAAAPHSIQFRRLDTDNSRLSHNYTTSVVKDSIGFVWIGTTNGLNRYDGQNVRAYWRGDLDLPSSAVLDLAIDRQGAMWVHTDNGDAFYDRITDRFVRGETCVFAERERISGEMLEYMLGELGFADRLKGTVPRTVHIDSDGRMWLGTSRGIWVYDSSDGSTTWLHEDPDDPFSLSDNRVNGIFTDSTGEIWIATETGLNFANAFSSKFRKYTSIAGTNLNGNHVNGFANDGRGKLWISTERCGLFTYSWKDGTFGRYSNPGVMKIIMGVRHFLGRLWILGEDGFQTVRTETGEVRNITEDRNGNRIGAIRDISLAERCGTVFVATRNGVYRFDAGTSELSPIPEIGEIFVERVTETSDGSVWMATYSDGVLRYSPGSGKVDRFRHSDGTPDSIPEKRVVSVFESRDRTLWFCTFGSGIARLNPEDSTFTAYNSRTLGRDFVNDLCISMVQDSRDNLWVGTSRGMLRFCPSDCSVVCLTKKDGLLNDENNQFSTLISPNDDLFIGTSDGITVFNTNAVYAGTGESRIIISDFYVGGKRVSAVEEGSPLKRNIDLTESVALRSGQNSFGFEIAQLNSHQSGSDIEYRLKGFSDGWTGIGESRRAEFTNIPSGDYVFEVRPANMPGNRPARSVEVHIARPAYASWWAMALYALAGAAAFWIAARLIRKRLTERERERQEATRQEQEKEMLSDKMMFLSNVVHEIKTPLTLIKSPLNNILRTHPDDSEMLSDIRIIDDTTSYLTSLSNELLEYIRVERKGYILEKINLDLAEKLRGILFNYSGSAAERGIEIATEIPSGPLTVYADSSSLNKIINNLLTNALKYCASRIEVALSTDGKDVRLCVRNDGETISDEWKERIFKPFSRIDGVKKNKVDGIGLGLSLARSLAEMQDGTLELDNSGAMTEFVLSLPASAAEAESAEAAPSGTPAAPETGVEESVEEPSAAGKFSVAVAEDNPELRDYIVSQLSKEYRVYSVENGTAALKCLHEHNIDLLITDIAMPEMDGTELCRKVRADVEISHVMIIVVSGLNDMSRKIECMRDGANLYIEKPFDIYYLKVCAANLLDKMQLTRKTLRNSLNAGDEDSSSLSKADREFLGRVDEIILQNFSDAAFNVENLKEAVNMSKSSLLRKFNRLLNTSPNNYIRTKRLLMAAQMFDEGADRVSDVCYSCGFNSTSYFAKCFQSYYGMTPIEYMKK